MRALIDSGPLVAFCDRRNHRHEWVAEAFHRIEGPLLTCEAVMAEALYLVRHRADMQDGLLGMVEKGFLLIPFKLEREVGRVRELRQAYRDVPMSLADACLLQLAEVFDDHHVCTFDSGFTIYRKHGRTPVPLILPP